MNNPTAPKTTQNSPVAPAIKAINPVCAVVHHTLFHYHKKTNTFSAEASGLSYTGFQIVPEMWVAGDKGFAFYQLIDTEFDENNDLVSWQYSSQTCDAPIIIFND